MKENDDCTKCWVSMKFESKNHYFIDRNKTSSNHGKLFNELIKIEMNFSNSANLAIYFKKLYYNFYLIFFSFMKCW